MSMANMYGYNTSNAHKLDAFGEERGHERHNEAARRKAAIENAVKARNAKRAAAAARIRKFLKAAVCFAAAFVVISRYVAINEANAEITQLKKEYNGIIAANQDLQAKIDKTVDLKKLQTVASEKLGMVKPERYQIFYVDMQMGDYSENVAASKADSEREKIAVTGVPGTIIGSMKIFK